MIHCFYFLWVRTQQWTGRSQVYFECIDRLPCWHHEGCASAPIFKQDAKVPFSAPPQWLSFVLLITAFLTGVRWYLPVALICISVMVGDMKHFKMYRVAICSSPFGNCLRGLLPVLFFFFQTGYLFLYSLIDLLLLRLESLICDISCLWDVRFASLCPTR